MEGDPCPICNGPKDELHKCITPAQKATRKFNAKRTKNVSIERMQRQVRTVLAREIEKLMEDSIKNPLERDRAVSLRGYIQLLNELEELDKIKALETTKDRKDHKEK